MSTETNTTSSARRRRIAAAASMALGAGAVAIGALAMAPAANAETMTFAQACPITHGWLATVTTANIYECHWQDSDGNEWIRTSPIHPKGSPPSSPSGTPFAQACVITKGSVANVVTAGSQECHWQDPDGNEHIKTNPLPNTKPPVVVVHQPPVVSAR